jgi:3',5'-cyclic AMP phosphodiesterase CpdA
MVRPTVGLILVTILAAGCGSSGVPRGQATFAVLAGVYLEAETPLPVEGAMVEEAAGLLRKAVADLNTRKNLDFVLVAGDLLGRADGASLDLAKAILADLKVPYYCVLGASDGPGSGAKPVPGNWNLPASAVAWAFQGHGFSGPEGYWSHEVLPGLMVVGLNTVRPGQSGGHVDARQLEWLDKTLSANAGKAVLVVGYHQILPLHPMDEGAGWRHKLVDNAAEVRQVLERHPNVILVVAGGSHFAEGQAVGHALYLGTPSVGLWPLAYQWVRLTPQEAEAMWVPLADPALSRRAQDRLLASPAYRGVFPPGEDGDTACVRLFGGRKLESYPVQGGRP